MCWEKARLSRFFLVKNNKKYWRIEASVVKYLQKFLLFNKEKRYGSITAGEKG